MHDLSLAIFACIALILLLLPVPIHLRARNVATLVLIVWLFLANLNLLINSIHWWDSATNSMPVFCDISIRFSTGLATGLQACSLCIHRRLATIAAARSINVSQRKTRISMCIDLALCIGAPLAIMALSYVVQPHRFDVIEGQGCSMVVFPSLPAVFLVYIWPVVFGCISAVYGIIAMKHFLARRLQFQSLLRDSESGLDTNHYLRLMAMASADVILGIPLSIAFLAIVSTHLTPYRSWDWVHYDWGFVREVPQDIFDLYFWTPSFFALTLLSRWLAPLLAFIIFLFFGVSDDAIREYTKWCRLIQRRLRRRASQRQTSQSFVPKLGSTVAKPHGLDWNAGHSVKCDEETEAGVQSPSFGITGNVSGGSHFGTGIAVHVERQVV